MIARNGTTSTIATDKPLLLCWLEKGRHSRCRSSDGLLHRFFSTSLQLLLPLSLKDQFQMGLRRKTKSVRLRLKLSSSISGCSIRRPLPATNCLTFFLSFEILFVTVFVIGSEDRKRGATMAEEYSCPPRLPYFRVPAPSPSLSLLYYQAGSSPSRCKEPPRSCCNATGSGERVPKWCSIISCANVQALRLLLTVLRPPARDHPTLCPASLSLDSPRFDPQDT